MSGIVGIYSQENQAVGSDEISVMLQASAYRGPDGNGVWVEDGIGLGHQMLWTTPESLLEDLPYYCPSKQLAITADARIDNRDDLIPVLSFGDRPSKRITDSQIILAAYKKWGKSCVDHLLGAFAFAIWDREQELLFCARDHFGVKPFYFHQSDIGFFFASEMKSILALPMIPRQINEVRIGDFLVMMMEDKSITSYQNIYRLPPASCMTIAAQEVQKWSYWSLDPNLKLKLDTNEAYAHRYRAIFTEAVRCRLRSAFTLGVQLSGGLDSSSVTCVAREILANNAETPLHTVSNIFEEVTECDERDFINEVITEGNIIPHFVMADQVSPVAQLEQIWQYEDEAFVGPNHFLPWQLNQAAQNAGIRVFLDGFDGDTTVSHGIHKLTELADAGDWRAFKQEATGLALHFNSSSTFLLHMYGIPTLIRLARQFRWLDFWQAVIQIHTYFHIPRRTLFLSYGLKSMIPKSVWQHWQKLRWNLSPDESVATLINQTFADRIGLAKRQQEFETSEAQSQNVRDAQWHSLNTGLLVFVLELLDRSAAAFSIEPRHPFMDKRLIEFCYSIPSDQKLSQGWSRMIVRRALDTVLPEKIQWRGGKTSMTPNFVHGMLNLDRQKFDEVVYNSPNSVKDYIDVDFLQEAFGRITSGAQIQDSDIMTVWKAMTITLWLRHHQMMPDH